MDPSIESPNEASQDPLPPQHTEERHTVLPQLCGSKERRLDAVGDHHKKEDPVLDLDGRHNGLGGLDEGLVEDGARGDEGAPRAQGHHDGDGGVGCYAAGLVPQGKAGDLDWLGVL